MSITNRVKGHDDDFLVTGRCSYISLEQINKHFSDKAFSIMALNVRSLASCFDELKELTSKIKAPFSVISLQEVWSISKAYSLPDFHPLQTMTRDREGPVNPNCGGGVGIYVHKSLDFEPLPSLNSFIKGVYESVWVQVKDKNTKNGQSVIVGSIYRPNTPPLANLDLAISTHTAILDKIKSNKHLSKSKIFITSDFNLDISASLTSEVVNDYITLQASYGLSPLITISAHPTPTSNKVIDHIFSSVPPQTTLSGVLLEHLSDHLPLVLSDFSTTMSKQLPAHKTRNFSEANIKNYINLLKKCDFSISLENPKLSFDNFFLLITEAADLAFPLKEVGKKGRSKTCPWMSGGLLKSAKTKKVLFTKKLKFPSEETRKTFSIFNKVFNKCKKAAKNVYFLRCFEDSITNIKKTWNLINEVTGRARPTSSLPSTFTIPPPPHSPPTTQSSTTSDPLEIANGFNGFFNTIGPHLSDSIDQSKFPGNHFSQYMGQKPEEEFKLYPVTINTIMEIVKDLKSKSSAGSDHLSNHLVKKAIHVLVNPLKELFDISLKTGFVPSQMTLAKVIPLHKEGDKGSFTNYRPIAVISTVGKILEKIVHSQLSDFLTSQNVLTPSQFGFRTHHGVEHPLVLFSERVRRSLSAGKTNISVFIDLKKAFDTVNHAILLSKLEHYGVRGVALTWFKNYLKRSQYVLTGGEVFSSILEMLCGIPQGTVLGPLLFLLFVNDFAFCTLLWSLLFADDCTLQGEGEDIPQLMVFMNAQLLIAEKWFVANSLTLNIKKTKYVIFHPSPPLPSTVLPPLRIGDAIIDKVGAGQVETSVRFLGVLIDDKMFFKEHISQLKKKLAKGLFALSSAKLNAPLRVRKAIYFSLFESYLRFGSLLYGCASEKELRQIELLQKKAIRLVAATHYLAHTDPLFQSLKILKLQDLLTLERAIFVHKFKHGKLPVAFTPDFLIPITPSEMSRRQDPECYSQPPNDHPFNIRSTTAHLIQSWNLIPYTTKIIGSHKLFKRDLMNHFFNTYNEICSKQNCRSCGIP